MTKAKKYLKTFDNWTEVSQWAIKELNELFDSLLRAFRGELGEMKIK